ncbi:MAG: hypothetical protein ACI97A_002987 [Planctomycetota bacterium]|jgi:hypothetical protein
MASAWNEIKALHKQSTFGAKEGLAFKLFSRPLASLILYFIKDTKITPNQVTIMSLIVGLFGTVTHIMWLSYAGLIVGGILFMLAHMLDALDGQLARARKAGSVIGMFFDFFIDELKAYFLYMAIGFRLYQQVSNGVKVKLLDPIVDYWGSLVGSPESSPEIILYITVIGMTGLAIGISCTQFVKRQEWLDAFPAGEGGGEPSALAKLIGIIEKGGKFVVDYPSYIILVCLIDMVEIYFLIYTLVICLYATRALSQIAMRLWRVNPYAKAE